MDYGPIVMVALFGGVVGAAIGHARGKEQGWKEAKRDSRRAREIEEMTPEELHALNRTLQDRSDWREANPDKPLPPLDDSGE